jgi:hypothetical protein
MEGNYVIIDELVRQEFDRRIARAQLEWRLRNIRSQGGSGMAAAFKRIVGAVKGAFPSRSSHGAAGQVREKLSY